MTSLSLDYVLTLVLATVLGVKYIIFDRDDHRSQDATVPMATDATAAAAAGDQLNNACVAEKSGVSDGQVEQIDDVAEDTLHREASDDITPTASSLQGCLSYFVNYVDLIP